MYDCIPFLYTVFQPVQVMTHFDKDSNKCSLHFWGHIFTFALFCPKTVRNPQNVQLAMIENRAGGAREWERVVMFILKNDQMFPLYTKPIPSRVRSCYPCLQGTSMTGGGVKLLTTDSTELKHSPCSFLLSGRSRCLAEFRCRIQNMLRS